MGTALLPLLVCLCLSNMLQSKDIKYEAVKELDVATNDTSADNPEAPSRPCRDLWCALLFLTGLSSMIWLVGANGIALRTAWDSSSLAGDVRAYSHDEAIQALAFSFGAALLFATAWLLFMLHCVKTAVYLTYLTVLLSEIAGTSGLFYLAGYDGWKPFNGKFLYSIAALLTLVTLYTVYLGWKLKSRVDLCASMVNITGTVLQSSPAVFVVAVLLVGVKFAYVVLCSAAMWTVHTDVSEYTSSHKNLITFGLVFMSFWGLSVISNIVMVTLYGTLGRWYHGQPAAVCNSLLRAVSTSFGSICCGSLVVASIQTSHKVCEFFQKKGWIPRWLMCIVDYIFSLLEAAIKPQHLWICSGCCEWSWFRACLEEGHAVPQVQGADCTTYRIYPLSPPVARIPGCCCALWVCSSCLLQIHTSCRPGGSCAHVTSFCCKHPRLLCCVRTNRSIAFNVDCTVGALCRVPRNAR